MSQLVEMVPVPASTRFPVEVVPPEGFDPEDPSTWPAVDGRLEWVAGRLWFMPPCGDEQAGTVQGLAMVLGAWAATHRTFRARTNEAGMVLGGETRGADGALWRAEHAHALPRFNRHPPVLAVEVAGRDETETDLRAKARWYLDHGVEVVWLVLPEGREVIVLDADGESRHRRGDRVRTHVSLPHLAPTVDDLFQAL